MRVRSINKALFATAVVAPITTTPLISCKDIDVDTSCHLMTVNDLHGAAAGYGDIKYPLNISAKNPGVERLANLFTNFKYTHPNTMFLSGGDANSGDCFSTATHGQTMYPLLKAMDFTYSAVGNHEFEWGANHLENREFANLARTDKTKGEYFVTSNILKYKSAPEKHWAIEGEAGYDADYSLWKQTKVEWASPYKVINIDGKHDICLIGLTTTATAGDPNPEMVKELSFIDYIASVNYAKRLAREDLGQDFDKIDAFVLLAHVGSDFSKEEGVTGESAEIAKNLNTRVDAILSAHSHKEGAGIIHNQKLGNDIWVGQGNTAGRAVLDTRLQFDDNKPVGQRLSSVSMELMHAPIEVGKDPAKPDIDAAANQLKNLRVKALVLGSHTPLYNTVLEYEQQRNTLILKFKEEAGKGVTTGEKYPASEHKEALGHQYIWPSQYSEDPTENYVIEEMGAWTCYAMMKGTVEIEKMYQTASEVVTPSIGLINFDSITQQFLLDEGQTERPITYGDLFQLQTYENPMYLGYLTVGQICNLIDYMLAGKETFNYETKPSYADNAKLTNDWITGQPYEGIEPIDDGYVCAPPQLWGIRYETRKDLQKTDDGKIIREYSLDYVEKDGKRIPKLWIYYAKDPKCKMEDPSTWISAEELMNQYGDDVALPFSFNKFTWDGSNHQLVMLQKYMRWNENRSPEEYKVLSFGEFSRDAIMKYCESITEKTNVDFTKEWAHKLVVLPE